MSGMAMVPEVPEAPGPHGLRSTRSTARSTAAWIIAVLAVSVMIGLAGGLIWGELAPRAMLEEVGAGTAQVVNAETRAFFGADVWFSGIAVVAGLLTGLLGYRFAVVPRDAAAARAAVTGALVAGALAGGLVMLWLGERIGLSGYNQHLASSATGTLFASSLALGSKSALAIWPLFTAIVVLVAEWSARPAAEQPPL
jgi:hypothetical protein